jgi:polyhydroxyalkanoate synthase
VGAPERLPGNVPGSYLNTLSVLASPKTFQLDRWLDWLSSMGDAEAAQTHLRVERWALDETPLPRRLFAEIAAWLYREDRFMRGTLELGGRRAAPERPAIPVLCAADPRCDIVPPQSVIPFYEALPGANKALLWYHGDTGVAIQHVGLLVGRNAHRRLWPEILRWLSGALAHDGSGKRGRRG